MEKDQRMANCIAMCAPNFLCAQVLSSSNTALATILELENRGYSSKVPMFPKQRKCPRCFCLFYILRVTFLSFLQAVAQLPAVLQPTSVVHNHFHGEPVSIKTDEPAAKKAKSDGTISTMLNKGMSQQTFLKDITRAFAACNVPLSKLDKGSPMRALFEKYMVLEGQKIDAILVDPSNLRGTWLPKVIHVTLLVFKTFFSFQIYAEGLRKLQDKIRDGAYFVSLSTDETDDPRSTNDYIVAVEITLIPKIVDQEIPCKVCI